MDKQISYVTLTGMPLSIELRWPVHKSTSGGDFQVLHGVVTLADGSGLHANVSLHLSAAVQELLPSLDEQHAGVLVINALRKWTDKKELEFIKSTKLQPLPLSSRFLHFKTKQWRFEEADEPQIKQLLKDELYWSSHKLGGAPVAVANPIDVIYVAATPERFAAAAKELASEGWATVSGETMTATPKVASASEQFETRARTALEAVLKKHAFESSKTS